MADRNPFSPPLAQVGDVHVEGGASEISSLPVSDSWKTKFRLIEKAGGPKQGNLKALPFGERFMIGFNVIAFLFGPVYYAVKGMWRRGLSLFAVGLVLIVILSIILDALGMGRVGNSLGYGLAAIFAVRANIDQYKKWVLRDNGWW